MKERPVILEPTGDILTDLLARTTLRKRNREAIEHTPGGVTIKPPTARGAALLIHKERIPEFDEGPLCTKCGSKDVTVVVNFPGDDGIPIQLCRTCVNRPPGNPVVVAFRG